MNVLKQAWEANELGVVEDVPGEQAKVLFQDPDSGKQIELREIGQVLTPTNTQDPPKITWNSQQGVYYTVLMTDPDAPSRKNPTKREWYHFGEVNIKGNDLSTGDVITNYVGAGPPKETGLHRYVILVYQQVGKIDASKMPQIGMTGDGRQSKKARDLAKNLGLGKLVAGACFQAEWDDYVPKLYEKLF